MVLRYILYQFTLTQSYEQSLWEGVELEYEADITQWEAYSPESEGIAKL
ncbi:MAG: hypothetical protein ACEPOZ_18365 [Marinifilaceae bacterium]